MEITKQIPKILIYEEFDGHPIYRKGYRDFVLGIRKIEEINMGSSKLQSFIIGCILRNLIKFLPENYFIASSELGLHLEKNTNFAADIAIFKEGQFSVGFDSTKYSEDIPNTVIEVDIKIDGSEFFRTEEEYSNKKTERLLAWGVERVIWIFPASRRVLVADNAKKWELLSWDLPIEVIDGHEINVWELLLKNGFQPEPTA